MVTYNHTGHVVTDLERSKRFYQEVFGFRLWYEITPPDVPTAQLTGLTPPLGVTASYLTLDGFVLELMHYAAAGAVVPFRTRTMSEPGLTHLSISVDDVHAAAKRAIRFGGEIVEGHRHGPVYPRSRRPVTRVAASVLPGQSATQALSRHRAPGVRPSGEPGPGRRRPGKRVATLAHNRNRQPTSGMVGAPMRRGQP
jgi:lactoylglutathione lyase